MGGWWSTQSPEETNARTLIVEKIEAKKVVVFGKTTCPSCAAVKELFEKVTAQKCFFM